MNRNRKKPEKLASPRRLEDRAAGPQTVIAADTRCRGNIEGDEGVRISGRLTGKISSRGLVWIEETGEVRGDIQAPFLIVEGRLRGDVVQARHVEIRRNAVMRGNIRTDIIAIADGGRFEGDINLPDENSRPHTFRERRRSRKSDPDPSAPEE